MQQWTLQGWLGHGRIDETMRHVHLVEEQQRPIPSDIIGAPGVEVDPGSGDAGGAYCQPGWVGALVQGDGASATDGRGAGHLLAGVPDIGQ